MTSPNVVVHQYIYNGQPIGQHHLPQHRATRTQNNQMARPNQMARSTADAAVANRPAPAQAQRRAPIEVSTYTGNDGTAKSWCFIQPEAVGVDVNGQVYFSLTDAPQFMRALKDAQKKADQPQMVTRPESGKYCPHPWEVTVTRHKKTYTVERRDRRQGKNGNAKFQWRVAEQMLTILQQAMEHHRAHYTAYRLRPPQIRQI